MVTKADFIRAVAISCIAALGALSIGATPATAKVQPQVKSVTPHPGIAPPIVSYSGPVKLTDRNDDEKKKKKRRRRGSFSGA